MNFLEKLDFMMDKLGINKSKLSSMSGVPYTTIDTFYKKGYENTKLSTIKKISEALDVSMDYLLVDTITDENYGKANGFLLKSGEMEHIKKYRTLDPYGQEAVDGVLDVEWRRCEEDRQAKAAAVREEREQTSREAAEEIEPEEHKVIHLLFDEEKTAAGSGYQLLEDRMAEWKVLYNDITRKADFCIEVEGRSMEPIIKDGDIILVRQQPAVEIGEIGLFTVNDKGYVKKQGPDRLISVNAECEDIYPNEYDNVICRGKVIGVLDPEWIVER